MGRWSRLVGAALVGRLGVDGDRRWLVAGCGTGASAEAIVESAEPAAVVGIDPSPAYVEAARQRVVDRRVRLAVGDAMALGLEREFDVAVPGLVLNFLPDPLAAVTGMARAVSVRRSSADRIPPRAMSPRALRLPARRCAARCGPPCRWPLTGRSR